MENKRTTRRYLKPEQRRRIAERCRASGLEPSRFARRHGYKLSSLWRWLAEQRREPPALLWQEVRLPVTPASACAPCWALEIVSPDGLILRCRDGLPWEDLVRLLRSRPC